MPAFDATAGKPGGKRVGVVIASRLGAFLDDRQPAEFAGADHQGRVQQAALLEIGQQCRDRLVGLAGKLAMIAGNVDVAVPAELVFHAAGENLHEPHAALDQPPRQQRLPGEGSAFLAIDAVESFDLGRFLVDVERLGGRRLHAVGQFEVLDPGGQFRFGRVLFFMPAVELGQQGQVGGAGLRRSCGPAASGC